jgi:hypothetical protein
MFSYLIDCVLAKVDFPKLGCTWDKATNPVYTAFRMMWAQNYKPSYKLICEGFIMPLYEKIFKEEPNCLSENAVEVLENYGDFYFSEQGTYLRMFGGTKAPYILPQYATDYVVLKEAVRQIFLDGIGAMLHKQHKASFPPLPFCIGAYKFSGVASAEEFV